MLAADNCVRGRLIRFTKTKQNTVFATTLEIGPNAIVLYRILDCKEREGHGQSAGITIS